MVISGSVAAPSPVSTNDTEGVHDGAEPYRSDRMKAESCLPPSDQLAKFARMAHAPTLLMTTAHLTGDRSLLRPDWQPQFALGGRDGGYDEHMANEIRRACCDRLLDFAARQATVPPRPGYDTLSNIANWLMGRNMDPYIRAIKNGIIFEGDDPCEPRWSKKVIAADRPFNVVIIGAGASGLLAAYRLKQAGVPFTILEKNDDVGGVWENNRYPGARVDLNSFVYSYSFAQRIWKSYYAEQAEIAEYFRSFAREHGLYEHIRLGTEVERCTWDEQRGRWIVNLAGDTGRLETNILVSAVGQLSRPKMPEIPGLRDFQGPQFHSAQWDHSVDFKGKRIGVVGNAASAMQFIPRLAEVADQLTIFMRTPNWLAPQPLLHEEVGEAERWLMQNLPYYAGWYRAFEYIPTLPGFPEVSVVDSDFPPTEIATSAANAGLRAASLDFIERQISDRPDLRPYVVPDHPIASKRFVADNGTWIKTLKRENVSVVQSPIAGIDSHSLTTADDASHPMDVLIYATGFKADEFLMPMEFIGRNDVSLHQKWSDEARAYLGMTVPDFPNLFLMYGPNTNLLVNLSSAINFFEGQTNYIVDAIRHLLISDAIAVEVRSEVFEHYNERLDEASALRTWQWSNVSSWYKGRNGRSAQNYPFTA